ncbi:MAG TPA: cytochrome c3 family protein, partial [Candidatus Limnocylindrales bacterium]|nr:cytochrome c3 family protein [Candidatus Limnocylindrales bacterium]
PEPTPDATPEPTLDPTPEPTPEPTPDATPDPSAATDQLIAVSHFTIARVRRPETLPLYLAPDTALLDEPRFEVFRLRFELLNQGTDDVALAPLVEFARSSTLDFAALPERAAAAGSPFYAAPEWVAAAGGGTTIGPAFVTVPADSPAPDAARSSGLNPMPAVTIRAGAGLIVEFSVRATADAPYGAEYVFRLTDTGVALAAPSLPHVRLEDRPRLELSDGQRSGTPAGDAVQSPSRYRLNPSSTSVHAPAYDLVSDTCASCHRAHTASGSLLNAQPTQYALCASCHNGTYQPSIGAAYVGVPGNDAAARAYYQHDPTAISGVPGQTNDCAECHNPHNISTTAAAETASGWTASGRLAGVRDVDLEYQLCYRCHASPATLPSNTGQLLSRYALDKAVEFDPGNASYHPIEAAGTNTNTTQMDQSLAGTSPYKLWNFTSASTIRCVNCHADARIADAALDGGDPLAASADLPVHASTQRGILLAAYQDRTLNGPLEPYQAADFALCYLCHAEAPFVDTSGNVRNDTNFRYHGLHVNGPTLINHGSDGTDIDTPGDGGGLATCAECHFRIHSSAYPVYGQPAGSRLVDFAPNVSGGATTANWQPKTDSQPGTCSLKCHGQPHIVDY